MKLQAILHPTDYSDLSREAFRYAVELAHDHEAKLLVLHVVDTLGPENVTFGEVSQRQPESYQKRLWDEIHRIISPDPSVRLEYLLCEGDPVTAIAQAVKDHQCDLVVLGSHCRKGLQRLLEGSIAEYVIREAPCPILVVPPYRH